MSTLADPLFCLQLVLRKDTIALRLFNVWR
jgi:hypothetical protein